jgi:hypothetical protein
MFIEVPQMYREEALNLVNYRLISTTKNLET